MRRIVVIVVALAAALLVLAAPPASAGGPTSVLIVNYDGSRASGALTGSAAYADLEKALDVYTAPTGDATAPGSFMGTSIRLTWMMHDVIPWRLDTITIDGADVWVETTTDESGGATLFEARGVRHRPKDADLLVTTLTSLGIIGEQAPGGSPSPAPSPAVAPATAAPAPAAATEPAEPAGVSWWVTAASALAALSLGVVLGRRVPPRPGRGARTAADGIREWST